MKKIILLLMIFLSLISCEKGKLEQIPVTKLHPYYIYDNRGNLYTTFKYEDLNLNQIQFKDKDGTYVKITGNYTIIKYN